MFLAPQLRRHRARDAPAHPKYHTVSRRALVHPCSLSKRPCRLSYSTNPLPPSRGLCALYRHLRLRWRIAAAMCLSSCARRAAA
ncbi:hypothetical protein HBI51_250360 [Parastagonospora nodorum]|nr:hypothetical protein HBI51_250360 [Parastagonospora nodorum]KAH6380546.1 hypothetical protein HBI08_235750 [Parastagonospora nodorum]